MDLLNKKAIERTKQELQVAKQRIERLESTIKDREQEIDQVKVDLKEKDQQHEQVLEKLFDEFEKFLIDNKTEAIDITSLNSLMPIANKILDANHFTLKLEIDVPYLSKKEDFIKYTGSVLLDHFADLELIENYSMIGFTRTDFCYVSTFNIKSIFTKDTLFRKVNLMYQSDFNITVDGRSLICADKEISFFTKDSLYFGFNLNLG